MLCSPSPWLSDPRIKNTASITNQKAALNEMSCASSQTRNIYSGLHFFSIQVIWKLLRNKDRNRFNFLEFSTSLLHPPIRAPHAMGRLYSIFSRIYFPKLTSVINYGATSCKLKTLEGTNYCHLMLVN